MPNDPICWPAYPFRREPVRTLKQASLQNRPVGVPFPLLDREGKQVWLVIPSADQIERLRKAFPAADIHNPPWAEIFVRVSRRGMSSNEIEKLAVPAILDSLAPTAESDASAQTTADPAQPQNGGTRGSSRSASLPPRDGRAPVLRAEREVDWPGALAQLNGDDKMLHEVAGVFLSEISGMLDRVRQAIAMRDGPLLRCAAQSLRESLAYMKAAHSYELASRLEESGRNEDLTEVELVFSQLEKRLGRVKREIASVTRIRTGRGR